MAKRVSPKPRPRRKEVDRTPEIQRAAARAGILPIPGEQSKPYDASEYLRQLADTAEREEGDPVTAAELRRLAEQRSTAAPALPEHITLSIADTLAIVGEGYTQGRDRESTAVQIAASSLHHAAEQLQVLCDAFEDPHSIVLYNLGLRLEVTAKIVNAIGHGREVASL